MSQSQYRIDYANAGVLALGSTSVTATLPINRELFMVVSAGNAHFRISPAAQATAVATDPMVTAGGDTLIVRINPGVETNISAIQDGSATGNLSYFPVFED